MKVVHVVGTRGYPSYYGGFETAVRNLAPYLADEGWKVRVYGRGASQASESNRDPRIEVVHTVGLEKKSLSTLSYGLTSIIHSALARPDAVLVMNVANGYWLPFYRLLRVPTIVNVDGIEWEREKWGRLAKSVFRLGALATSKFATQIVSDSVEIQRIWLEQFKRESIFIPYGGDVGPGSLPPLGLEKGTYVLMVARFVPENTVEQFFEAAEALAKTHSVVIVGSSGYGGILDQTAQSLADRLSSVTWLGHVSDDSLLHSLWANAGAYFHGHSVGGTNPALVQAMACGAPIVARDTVYNREVLATAGLFVEPTPSAIASACAKLLDDRSARLAFGAAAMARARSDYSWSAVNSKYEESLRGLTSSGTV